MKNVAQLLLALAFGLLSLSAQATAFTITVGDNFYSPKTLAIHAGDVVTWQYQDGAVNPHPTASDNGTWTVFTINSANVSKSLTFPTPGSFPYHCQFHGSPGTGMFGDITVSSALAVPAGALASAAFSVYPNPASSAVTLVIDGAQPRTAHTALLLDPLGRVVQTLAVRPDEVGHELAVGLADLPAGIYCFRLLATKGAVATQRLVLVR